jgi:hypothetical protein
MMWGGHYRRVRGKAGDGGRDAGGEEEKDFAGRVNGVSLVLTVVVSFLEREFQFVAMF